MQMVVDLWSSSCRVLGGELFEGGKEEGSECKGRMKKKGGKEDGRGRRIGRGVCVRSFVCI